MQFQRRAVLSASRNCFSNRFKCPRSFLQGGRCVISSFTATALSSVLEFCNKFIIANVPTFYDSSLRKNPPRGGNHDADLSQCWYNEFGFDAVHVKLLIHVLTFEVLWTIYSLPGLSVHRDLPACKTEALPSLLLGIFLTQDQPCLLSLLHW